jgi:hypothetical protein
MDIEEELEELEKSFDSTKKDFESAKSDDVDDELMEKQEDAEELIQEIRGQLEFLRDAVDESEDF